MRNFSDFGNRVTTSVLLSIAISAPVWASHSTTANKQAVHKTPRKPPVSHMVRRSNAQLAMFGLSKKSKEEPQNSPVPEKQEQKSEAAPANTPADKPAAEGVKPLSEVKSNPPSSGEPGKESGEAPALVPDAALISVLKDLSRELKDYPDVEKLEDPCQKAAAHLAQEALNRALANPKLPSNRIVPAAEKSRFESSMRAEAWDSGDIAVSGDCHASLSAVWAKKVDGLVNLAIAGNCNCKPTPGGSKLGEFLFVLNGKSTVDKGFDIQSQSDVNFWLGKISSFNVDTACCGDNPLSQDVLKDRSLASTVVLKAVLTERTRKYLADMSSYEEQKRLLAQKDEQAKVAQEKAEADAKAKEKEELEAKVKAEVEAREKAAAKAQVAAKPAAQEEQPHAEAAPSKSQSDVQRPAVPEDPRTAAYFDTATGNGPQMAMAGPMEPAAPSSNQKGWDSPQPLPAARIPSSAARIFLPDKAIAGQFLTAAVLNPNHAGEALVGLLFNGGQLATGQDGRALYMVPEDSVPGPSLHVGLSGRPEEPASTVTVIQPLSISSGQQIPRVDMVSPVVQAGGMITLDGHFFDGVADRNRIIIDGMYDARVLVSSPVQLKADLPSNLIPGEHSISVSTNDLRSNPGQFEIISVDIQPDLKEVSRDALTRLIVRVAGTKSQVRVHLKNYTPEVIRLPKGNEQFIVTPGGPNNALVVGVQRLKPGNYHVQATID